MLSNFSAMVVHTTTAKHLQVRPYSNNTNEKKNWNKKKKTLDQERRFSVEKQKETLNLAYKNVEKQKQNNRIKVEG